MRIDNTFLYLEQDNEACFGRICNFGSKEKQIILLGDSHLGSLAYDLYDKTKSDYSFLSITSAGYFHLKNVNQINKHSKKINIDYDNLRIKIDKILKKSRDNIIILGGATSLYFYNKRIEDRALHWDNLFVDKKSKKHNPQVVEGAFIDLIDELSKEHETLNDSYEIGTDAYTQHTMKMTPGQPIQNFRKYTDTIKPEDIIKFENEDDTIDKYKTRYKERWKEELDKAVQRMKEEL